MPLFKDNFIIMGQVKLPIIHFNVKPCGSYVMCTCIFKYLLLVPNDPEKVLTYLIHQPCSDTFIHNRDTFFDLSFRRMLLSSCRQRNQIQKSNQIGGLKSLIALCILFENKANVFDRKK